MHALMVNHFLKGAYYPVGGAASIAYEMLETVAAGGGWTAVRRPVTSIIVHKGSAVGVRLADGTEIPSRRVISASGLSSTANMLPPETLDLDHRFSGAGPAHVSLYLGFEGEISAAGAFKYSQWFFESWDMEIDSWDIEPGVTRNRAPVLFCSFPSLKDPKHDPGAAQRHTGEAITFVPWRSFKRWLGTKWQKRGSEYDWFKEQLTERLLGQYDKHYPDLTPMIRHAELSTPLSTYHFARSYQGSIYGLATEPERFLDDSLVPKTRVRGLFLAGTDVMTPGVAGAMGGGILAAVAAEPIGAIRYLRPLMKGKGSLTSV
jgi:all-trans-retinol 13,14-reductase